MENWKSFASQKRLPVNPSGKTKGIAVTTNLLKGSQILQRKIQV